MRVEVPVPDEAHAADHAKRIAKRVGRRLKADPAAVRAIAISILAYEQTATEEMALYRVRRAVDEAEFTLGPPYWLADFCKHLAGLASAIDEDWPPRTAERRRQALVKWAEVSVRMHPRVTQQRLDENARLEEILDAVEEAALDLEPGERRIVFGQVLDEFDIRRAVRDGRGRVDLSRLKSDMQSFERTIRGVRRARR